MRLDNAMILLLLGTLLGLQTQGEDLTTSAAREKERRARLKANSGPAKSYGNGDLGTTGELANDPSIPPAAGSLPQVLGDPGSPMGARTGAEPASTRAGGGTESSWRARAEAARKELAAAEAALRQAESAPRASTVPLGDYKVPCTPGRLLMPDGSLGPVTNSCTGGIVRERTEAAQSQIVAAQRRVELARQALANLEEEARRAGIPAGWVR